MWRNTLTLYVSLLLHSGSLQEQIYPQNCIRKGKLEGEYCRITQEDVNAVVSPFSSPFGACVPWPCNFFLGETPDCQHYVQGPQNVVVEFLSNPDPKHETAIISWSPSKYGIEFLRGFQVSLHALGGAQVACQLFLLQQNQSLTPSHTQRVYYSDPFPMLTLDTQYAVTVMALPVPEKWDEFYQKSQFSTRTCPEKNGLAKCKKDWYPTCIIIEQNGHDVNVTFNLAPPNLQLNQYFSSCYGGGQRTYTTLEPDLKKNHTHFTYRLPQLPYSAVNYTCEIAVDIVDAVKKKFYVEIPPTTDVGSPDVLHPEINPLTSLIPLGILLAITLATLLAVMCKRKRDKLTQKCAPPVNASPDIYQQFLVKPEEPCVAVTTPVQNSIPPSLLIVYSSADGPAHVRVVLLLAAFLQKHMAIKVFLDLWESLSLMEEGVLGWYCKKMAESDYVLVICSPGLHLRPQENKEDPPDQNMSSAIVAMIGEELCRTKAKGQDLSRYMTAMFDYSKETDVPVVFSLASHYSLTTDLPLLFSHLHGMALQQPGTCLQVEHISEDYSRLPAGEALQRAILEAKSELREQHECEDEKGGPTITTTTQGFIS
ncbi:interleukin-17 receptor D [Sardina pilchardus]|uniref:interleukin-17 receptor D n=1 Tax=Sardina pilchardus TaxID=27697 RepID=UPI002E0EF1FB